MIFSRSNTSTAMNIMLIGTTAVYLGERDRLVIRCPLYWFSLHFILFFPFDSRELLIACAYVSLSYGWENIMVSDVCYYAAFPIKWYHVRSEILRMYYSKYILNNDDNKVGLIHEDIQLPAVRKSYIFQRNFSLMD